MFKSLFVALCASTVALASPAASQDYPLRGGNFWTVAEITIDDGHAGDYADYLSGAYRKNRDFSKSKGWIRNSFILSNVNKRAGEPDLYLVTVSDRVPTPAEEEAREKEMNAFLATTTYLLAAAICAPLETLRAADSCVIENGRDRARLLQSAHLLTHARAGFLQGGIHLYAYGCRTLRNISAFSADTIRLRR